MSLLFRKDDALVLGILLSKYFQPPIQSGSSYNYSNGYSWGFVLGGMPSTGAGGGMKGDNGKFFLPDASLAIPTNTSLSGYGATQTEGGKGFKNGKFGKGGGEYQPLLSCGGGSGWFGGGSSYIAAGGGGGSGYVNTEHSPKPDGYNPPSQFFALFGSDVYEMGVNEGHGKCIINGIWVFEYTGYVQKFVVPTTGVYTIECFGAQGGGINGAEEKYTGGKGGYVKGDFFLTEGTELFIYVGQEGRKSGLRAWNGGGIGAGGAFGGGGATDVRWSGVEGSFEWEYNLLDRFIVAGGGGGQWLLVGAVDFKNLNAPIPTNYSPSGSQNEKDRIITEKALYIVNDTTKCTVDLTYLTTLDVTPNDKLEAVLYVDGERKASVFQPVKAGGGMESFHFNFSDWLPPDSQDRWVIIEAEIKTDLPIIVPPRGLVIRVSTIRRPNTEPPKDKPILSLTRNVFNIDNLQLVDLYRTELENQQGETIDNPDRVIDVVIVDDIFRTDLGVVYDSNIVDELNVKDLTSQTKIIVAKYDTALSTLKVEDVFFIELESKEPPVDIDAIIDKLGLEDVEVIDVRNVVLNQNQDISSMGVDDVHSCNKVRVLNVNWVDILNLVDISKVQGGGQNLDNLKESLDLTDIFYTSLSQVMKKSYISKVQMTDIYATNKVDVIKSSELDSVTVTDIFKIDLQ